MSENLPENSAYQRALSHLKRGEYELAEAALRTALKLNSASTACYRLRAEVYALMNRARDARADLQRALSLDLDADNASYYQSLISVIILLNGNENERALDELSSALALRPADARSLYYRAKVRLKLKQPQLALDDLTKAISSDQRCPAYYFERSRAYTILENADLAIGDLTGCLELNADYGGVAFVQRGILFRNKQLWAEAIADFDCAIRVKPSGEGYYHRGVAKLLSGDRESAIEDFQNAIRLDSKFDRKVLYESLQVDFNSEIHTEDVSRIACEAIEMSINRITPADTTCYQFGGLRTLAHLEKYLSEATGRDHQFDYIDRTQIEPLECVRAFLNSNPIEHWHYVTHGFSDLYGEPVEAHSESAEAPVSGYGFELSLRVERGEENEPPDWPLAVLQKLAKYVFASGNVFSENEHMSMNGPVVREEGCTIKAVGFVRDPELGLLQTASGRVEILQVVGLTADEYKVMKRWQVGKFLTLLSSANPWHILHKKRISVMKNPEIAAMVQEGIAVDGSSVGGHFVGLLKILRRSSSVEITLPATAVADLETGMKDRIPFGRYLKLFGAKKSVIFQPAAKSAIVGFDEQKMLVINLSRETAEEIGKTVFPSRGIYDLASFPELRFVVVPTTIKDSRGKIVKVVG